jgi:hypothetical protein
MRSSNNPVADYTEYIVADALSLHREQNSKAGFDGTDNQNNRHEIKARRLTQYNRSTQLSAIRNLDRHHFDFLAGVLFEEDFEIRRACLVPWQTVQSRCKYQQHTNSSRFCLNPGLWDEPGVADITEQVRSAQAVCS